ncbi:hypothetical protein KY342_06170 [Candidatus Woesearchaeota archaeon]|nr:hypothetical protein [Candidatus Woesearchaeota archaeon]
MKTKKEKKSNSKGLDKRDLDEHIVKLIEKQNKRAIKDSIDSVVKRLKKKQVKSKKVKARNKIKDVYGGIGKRDEYKGLQGTGVYDQIKFSPFVGFLYKSNIKDNNEFYEHLAQNKNPELKKDGLGERYLASSEQMNDYGRKTMLNFLIGAPMMTSGMSAVTFEEMEVMKFNLYDRTQNILYTAKLKIMGFGDQSQAFGSMITTTLKTMHAPVNDMKM